MRRLWLCLPPAVFALIDYAVTMRGQPEAYWSGNYDAVNEGNPVVRWCMTAHPALFHGLTFVWIAAFSAFIVKTPRPLARFASLAIAFSHAFCIGTWMYEAPDGFFRELALCIACAILSVIALELAEERVAASP
jgi:hypothetical protein